MVNWEEFDKKVNLNKIKDEEKQVQVSEVDYVDVPLGKYEVTISKIELTVSKKDKPMVRIWFNIINGEFVKFKVFMNQVIDNGFGLYKVNELLRKLNTGLDIKFESYKQYNDLLLDVKEKCYEREYELEYGENGKGYKTFDILQEFKKEKEGKTQVINTTIDL